MPTTPGTLPNLGGGIKGRPGFEQPTMGGMSSRYQSLHEGRYTEHHNDFSDFDQEEMADYHSHQRLPVELVVNASFEAKHRSVDPALVSTMVKGKLRLPVARSKCRVSGQRLATPPLTYAFDHTVQQMWMRPRDAKSPLTSCTQVRSGAYWCRHGRGHGRGVVLPPLLLLGSLCSISCSRSTPQNAPPLCCDLSSWCAACRGVRSTSLRKCS